MTEIPNRPSSLIRILLVEDNLGDMNLIKAYLSPITDCEFDFCWLRSVADTTDALSRHADDFDIVLVDNRLPDGKGLDLVNDWADRIDAPMIMLTGYSNRDLDVATLASGAADFLSKDTLNTETLDRAIRYAIERRQHSRSLSDSVSQLEASNRQLADRSAQREAEAANVIKLVEHLARPPEQFVEPVLHPIPHRTEFAAETEAMVGIWRLDTDGRSLQTNETMRRLLGVDRELASASPRFEDQFAEPDRDRALRELETWKSGIVSSFESRFESPDPESYRDLAISGCPVFADDGVVASIIVTVTDVTERRRAEALVRELAERDPLTSLLNRTTFLDMLTSAAAINRRNGTEVAVLYIDLDDFKCVNDRFGHLTGDDVLRVVASLMENSIRESDFAARLGGDEFAIALSNLSSPLGAAAVAENILRAVGEPFIANGESLNVGMSIGIAMFDGGTAEQCLKNADLALYRCKNDGGHAFAFFDPAMLEAIERRRVCEAGLEVAVENNEFRLFYQPQVSLVDGSTTGLEALIRWQRPGVGLVGPADFMEVAEDSGSIVRIGQWVAKTALKHAAKLPDNIPVAINMSAKELRQPDLPDVLAALVAEAGIPAARLTVEVTESAVLEDIGQSAEILGRIREHGIKVALDDFGTGYSSLTTLKRLPVDCLKIDGSFVRNICTDETDAAIAGMVIDLGRRLNLRIVAECIESGEQAKRLKDMGCEEVQGFHYHEPAAMPEIVSQQLSGQLHATA